MKQNLGGELNLTDFLVCASDQQSIKTVLLTNNFVTDLIFKVMLRFIQVNNTLNSVIEQ